MIRFLVRLLHLAEFLFPDHRLNERIIEILQALHQRRVPVDGVERSPALFPDLHHAPGRELVHGLCNGLAGEPDLIDQFGHVELDPVHRQEELEEPGLAGIAK